MTTAQRARLVVAMGLLNLILATVALTAGFVSPPRPPDGIALGSPVPTTAPGSSAAAPSATAPTPGETPAGSGEPAPSAATPSVEPSAVTTPSSRPPDAGPVVAVIPTPAPTAAQPNASPPNPTAGPPAIPTARPTARPTPTPNPVVGKVHKARPPCPDGTSGPPGHHKVAPPPARPCAGSDHGKGSSGSGVVVVLPLAIGGLAAALRTRLVRGSCRAVRGLRSTASRRRAKATREV